MPTTPQTSARVNSNGASSGRSTRSRAETLERQHRHVGRAVVEHRALAGPAGEPVVVRVDPGGKLTHEQQVIVVEPIGDQVVDWAAVFVEKERVLRLAHALIRLRSFDSIVWRYSSAAGSRTSKLADVAHVEDAGACSRTARCSGITPSYCTGISQPWIRNQPGSRPPGAPGRGSGVVAEGLGRVHPEAQSIHAFPGGSMFRHRRRVNRRGASSNPSARYAAWASAGCSALDALHERLQPRSRPQVSSSPIRLRATPRPRVRRHDGDGREAEPPRPVVKERDDRAAREAADGAVDVSYDHALVRADRGERTGRVGRGSLIAQVGDESGDHRTVAGPDVTDARCRPSPPGGGGASPVEPYSSRRNPHRDDTPDKPGQLRQNRVW